jgi:hypothetical protein
VIGYSKVGESGSKQNPVSNVIGNQPKVSPSTKITRPPSAEYIAGGASSMQTEKEFQSIALLIQFQTELIESSILPRVLPIVRRIEGAPNAPIPPIKKDKEKLFINKWLVLQA